MLLGLLTCREAVARLDLYIDRELTPREQKTVARHLKLCAHCARQFRFEAEVVAGLRAKLERIEAPPEIMERIRRALENEAETTA